MQKMQDHRTLPRVEMELVLTGKKIEFSPSCAEVAKHCSDCLVIFEPFHQTPISKGGGYDHLCCARDEQAATGGELLLQKPQI